MVDNWTWTLWTRWIFVRGEYFSRVNFFWSKYVSYFTCLFIFKFILFYSKWGQIMTGTYLPVGNFFFSKSLCDNISRRVLEKLMMIECFRGLLDMTNILPFLQRFPFMSFLRNFTIYQYSQNIFSGKF